MTSLIWTLRDGSGGCVENELEGDAFRNRRPFARVLWSSKQERMVEPEVKRDLEVERAGHNVGVRGRGGSSCSPVSRWSA